jgi:hypothetical protein
LYSLCFSENVCWKTGLARSPKSHPSSSVDGGDKREKGRKQETGKTKHKKIENFLRHNATLFQIESSIKHLDHRQISTYNAKNHSDVSSHAIWRLHASQGDSSSHPETAVDEIQEWSVKLLSSTVEPKRYTAAAAVI